MPDQQLNTGALTVSDTGHITTKESVWYHYRQVGARSINLGASGATLVIPATKGANATLGGLHLDNAPSDEYLYFDADVHNDWDAASDIIVEVYFEIETAGGGAGQTCVLDLETYHKQKTASTSRGQSLTASTIVGTGAAAEMFEASFAIDYDSGTDPVLMDDMLSFRLWWDDDTSTDPTHPIVHHVEILYKANKPRIEV